MNAERDIVIRIDRKAGLLMLASLAVVLGGYALADQLTLTTSYPVPSGIYNQLITTGNSGAVAVDTTFNRNAGNTILVPATNAAGMVGIGMAPVSKLSVAGGIQTGDDASACTVGKAGTIRWHAGAQQVCNGAAWAGTGAYASGTLAGLCYCGRCTAFNCPVPAVYPATACSATIVVMNTHAICSNPAVTACAAGFDVKGGYCIAQ
jgi:hypothetical protein